MLTGLSLLGGYWAYCEGHFATKNEIMNEVEERRELKAEVDAIYLRSTPTGERMPLKYPGNNH